MINRIGFEYVEVLFNDQYKELEMKCVMIWCFRLLVLAVLGLMELAAQPSRLLSSCKTSIGSGRCTRLEFSCKELGGIFADQILFSTLHKREPGCPRGESCCVLLPLPEEDVCHTCGLSGENEAQITTNEIPRRILPNFSAMNWSDWKARLGDDFEARISKVSAPNRWCWQVGLTDMHGTIFGSGALIDGQTVVTLAHNVVGRRSDDFRLVLGVSDFQSPIDDIDRTSYWTTPKEIFVHEQFDPMTFENDVAVLRIPLAPCTQENICPVCLNDLPVDADTSFDKDDGCVITGWGPPNSAGFTTTIRETTVKIVQNGECVQTMNDVGITEFQVPETQFCARSSVELLTNRSLPCETDGAPLVCKSLDKRWYLKGLVTLGTDSCTLDSSLPFLATDIGMLFSWINIKAKSQDDRFPGVPAPAIPSRFSVEADEKSGSSTEKIDTPRAFQGNNAMWIPGKSLTDDDMQIPP